MLRKIRITLAALFFAAVTLLFLDFTGTLHAWLGWTAKIQFLPALLALNVGVVVLLVLLTLVFGRVYCSVICPLGVMQDIAAWLGKKSKKNRYTYSPAKSVLRYSVLAVFVVAMIAGAGSLAALLAPYIQFVWKDSQQFVCSRLRMGKQCAGLLCRARRQLCFL